ncbi:NHLP bacteriocin export ABC transporter permease/ATPase subunit [Streptomyces sp. NPDC088725]|uniref:NHLP bacteriocin export ABC transporter permease/ATPase subunit n=1 Tax=Streptomyces sp. NPDC088725 TaxID=3365873 RepID=UPI003808E089
MSSVLPPRSAEQGPGAGDSVTDVLGALGTPVQGSDGSGTVPLEGPEVLWLVVSGFLDLFAVDASQDGPWHFLGRLDPGSLLLGPVTGPRHTLLGRLSADCRMRRIPLNSPSGSEAFTDDLTYDIEEDDDDTAAPLERAFAQGTVLGMGVMIAALTDGPTATESVATENAAFAEQVQWMPVSPGSVQYGSERKGGAEAGLLLDGALWQWMVNRQYRLLSAIDRWIDRTEHNHEQRAAASVRAGEAVRARADQTLLASIGGKYSGRREPVASAGKTDDSTFAVCRQVAEAAGITLTRPPSGVALDERVGPVQRLALFSRVRTREVRLSGPWWRADAGPLVGYREESGQPVSLLWRRGRYEEVDPVAETRTRIGPEQAKKLAPRAIMFYRPLPEEPLTRSGLLRFSFRGTRFDLRNLVISALMTIGLGALVPIATGKVLGVYVPNAEKDLIVLVALALMMSSIVTAAFMLLQSLTVLRLEGRIESNLQPAVWDRLLRLPTSFFAKRSTGELAGVAMSISSIRSVLSGTGAVIVQAITIGVINIGLLFWLSAPLALAAIAMLVFIGAVFFALGLWGLRSQRQLVAIGHKLNNQTFQTLRGLPKLRVAAAESFAFASWAKNFARSRQLHQRAGRIMNLTTVVNGVYLPLCSLIMYMLLAGPARGSMSAGAFLTFNTSVTMLLGAVTQLSGALVSATTVQPMVEQVNRILNVLPEVAGGSTQPGPLSGAIETKNLSFRYRADGPPALAGVSLRVDPGEFVAIVGPSGCGKSTLLRLLIGFEKPLSGKVLYDGQDLASLDQAAVRRQCGVVLQNAQPLTGTILDCIRGADSFTQDEIWEAAEMAGLADDIKRMPMGLHTVVSSGSGTISGGQRQRLMIAQALVRRPRILYFDEATSALDNEAQRVVTESTRQLKASRLVIAHRLSTVMDADRVIVMSEGKIVEQGTPAKLLAKETGHLHALVRRQLADPVVKLTKPTAPARAIPPARRSTVPKTRPSASEHGPAPSEEAG